MLKKLPPFARNFYFITGCSFLVWMLFLDSNNLIAQFKLRNKLSDLNEEKEFYQQKIEEVKEDREQLLTDEEMLEKFAREKYLMKKKSEDLYVIEVE
ncbi:MAG TPA: septum formation initiator [Cytophagales bacterium]|jgi:cell division protein DivIC|nr:septum formation initiator [Cytophagales bacterium]